MKLIGSCETNIKCCVHIRFFCWQVRRFWIEIRTTSSGIKLVRANWAPSQFSQPFRPTSETRRSKCNLPHPLPLREALPPFRPLLATLDTLRGLRLATHWRYLCITRCLPLAWLSTHRPPGRPHPGLSTLKWPTITHICRRHKVN